MNTQQVTVVEARQATVVRLDGDVDIAVAELIEAEILDQTEAAGTLVLDLSAVSFLDSAGIRMVDRLVGRHERAGARARVVVPPQSSARFSLRLCGFRTELFEDDLPSALATLDTSA